MPDATGPTVKEQKALRTEGQMQGCDDPVLSQGQVKSAGSSGMDEGSDGLQRALEGELVEFLRSQNSKLMQELECLKGQLQHVQVKAGSGDASSPWSAANGTSVEGSSGNGTFHAECMVDFKAAIGLCKCMVMLLNKLGLCGALCMVMLLYKVGLCIARCLEMMLYVALRLEMEELFTIGLCMALRLVIYLDMNDFMVALLNYMVFLVTDVFMVVLQKFLNYMVFIVTVMMVELQAQQLIKLPPVQALMVQDWVLRLLKSLRMPNLKVMRLSNLQPHAQMVLLDSGATHGLRPAVSEEEWQSGTRTQVMLADGVTESLRLKPGTKVLLSDPLLRPENTSWIVPMGCLNELNYKLVWKDHMCHLYTKAGEKIDVELHNGCPYVAHEFGAKLLTVLEQHQIQQELRKMTLKSILTRGAAGLGNNMSIEMAMLVKLKEVMPTLPEDLALKLVPDLSVLTDPNIGVNLPWNRRKRKRLMMAKNVIIHMYSGPDASYWERRLSNEHTEVLCVDLVVELNLKLQLLKQSADGFAVKRLHVKDLKILLALFTPKTMSDLLVSLRLEISLVILKNKNLEMVNHLNNMMNEISNKRAMKLDMNKVFLQELHKMNLILSKKNRWRSSTSSSGPVQAPSAGSSSYGPAQALSAGSSCGSGPVQAPMVRSLSSFGPVQASSSTSTGSITAERAGPEQAHFAGSGVGPEQAWRSTNAAAGASSSSAGLVQALRTMNAAVGASSSGAGPEQALRAGAGPVQAVVADDADLGPEQASSSSGAADLCADAEAAGLEQALRAAAGDGIERALRQRADEVREALRVGGLDTLWKRMEKVYGKVLTFRSQLPRFAEAAMYSALFSQGKPVSAIERRDRLMFQVVVDHLAIVELDFGFTNKGIGELQA
ncbi:unnamed protein product [Cladocopium goreaui]|uniref:rRNA biogenesis protein rrp5 n=1 Tax=Cladocopium goreaui TaxID=2562237 RepID=A0A9P1DUB9_9DINO|nr:unnamed protein product [Cladocopium goreaui]